MAEYTGEEDRTIESPGLENPNDRPEDLLARLRQRDHQALAGIVEQHGPALSRVAYLYLGDAHAADAVVQETFVAAWDGARRTTPATRLQSWIFGILLNRCRKHLRSLARRRRREREVAVRESSPADPSEKSIGLERLDALRAALAQLDPPLREVVILRYERGLSVEETAAALGIPEGTVKSQCHAAIERLRRRMEPEND